MRQVDTLQQQALDYHNRFDFVIIPMRRDSKEKRPAVRWRNITEQTAADIADYDWRSATGIMAILGGGGLRTIDFDQQQSPVKIKRFLELIGQPANYNWCYPTPGGGWHCHILCSDWHNKGIYDYPPANQRNQGDAHIELRADGGLIVLPPSLHPVALTRYSFFDGTPDLPPASITANTLLYAYSEIVGVSLADLLQNTTKPKAIPQNQQESHDATIEPIQVSPCLSNHLLERFERHFGVSEYDEEGYSTTRFVCPMHADTTPSAFLCRHQYGTEEYNGFIYCQACKRAYPLSEVATTLGWAVVNEDDPIQDIYVSNFPPTLFMYTCRKITHINQSKGRPSRLIRIVDISEWCEDYTATGAILTDRDIKTADLVSNKAYRIAAYPPQQAKVVSRKQLALSAGVSARTTRTYDEPGGVIVTPRYRVEKVTEDAMGRFTEDRKDMPGYLWLESTRSEAWSESERGLKFAPTKEGLSNALETSSEHGLSHAFLVMRLRNHYTPPGYSETQNGLPLQIRRMMISQKRASEARVYDALMLAGVKAGDALKTSQIIEICARYGIKASTVRSVLRGLPSEIQTETHFCSNCGQACTFQPLPRVCDTCRQEYRWHGNSKTKWLEAPPDKPPFRYGSKKK
jgi:hypothetical protein